MPQLRSTDGQLFELSEQAARLSATLQNALDDTAGDAPVPVPLGAASLGRVAALLERTVVVVEGAPEERRAELRKQGLPREAALDDELRAAAEAALAALGVTSLLEVAQLLRELLWFDAPLPATIIAERVARLLRGQPAAALRELLGVADGDFLSANEMSAIVAEPLCAPPSAPSAPVDDPAEEDMMEAFLERCDARTLRELKAVSAAWQRRARAVLCDAASAWRQQPIWSPSAEGRALAAQLGGGSAQEWRQVLQRMLGELDRSVDLPSHAWAVVPLLEDSDRKVRWWAVETLGKLEPAALAQHGAALAARLEDSNWNVRKAVVETLGKLKPGDLAQHGAALAARLEHSDLFVRRAAVETLGKLEPAALAQHGPALAARLEDSNWRVQIVARFVMHKLEPAAGHMDAVAAMLEDDEEYVRHAAVEMLGALEPAALAQYAAALVARLEDSFDFVRNWAVETLGKLEPAALAQYAAALAAKLEDDADEVRYAAVKTLGELESAALAQYEQALAKAAKEDEDEDVRDAAAEVLTKLRAGQ